MFRKLYARIPAFLKLGIVFVLLCGLSYFLTVQALYVYKKASSASLDSLVTCFATTTDPTFASKCLHKTVDTLLSQVWPRELQAYTVASTSPETIRSQCHPIGHIIGQEVFKRTGGVEVALSLCSNDCRSACTHGIIGAGVLAELGEQYPDEDIAHADNETLEKIGSQYCEKSPALCHAIGHLASILNQDDLPALQVCDHAAKGFMREACYQGMYMERAGNGEALFPFQKNANEPAPSNYGYPCLNAPAQYHHACFQFSPEFQKPLFAQSGITSTSTMFQKTTELCKELPERDRSYCLEGVGLQSDLYGYDATGKQNIQDLCNQFSTEEDRNSCTLGVIPKFLFLHERGIKYCSQIKEENRRVLCYRATFQWEAVYGNGTDAPVRICGEYPLCLSQYRDFQNAGASLPDYRFGLFGE